MRLSTIKLAGFKSFVDPTTLHLPTNMTGVVGPNGCGKSNIIDAVRWVMGESSASRLRGDSLTDVIFSGSSSRKPVGQATVELIFDNSDGTLSGEFAAFNEISVKRLVSRDGQSNYYLNGTRCRRRDITDLFLGTGLGPRSYSIIEQGMISQIIEARPEDLRVFLEEAAGISKYKERRKETEQRIRQARENLDRLNDVREEVDKQLEHLKRQARQAEQYQQYKEQQRIKEAQVRALEYRHLDTELAGLRETIAHNETLLEAKVAEQRQAESQIELCREQQEEANARLAQTQAENYRVGAEISRIEQQILHQRELSERLARSHTDLADQITALSEDIEHDGARRETLAQDMAEIEPRLSMLSGDDGERQKALADIEVALAQWQARWDEHSRLRGETTRAAEVERTKIEYLDRQAFDGERRREALSVERAALDVTVLAETLERMSADHDMQRAGLDTLGDTLDERKQAVVATQEQLRRLQNELAQLRKDGEAARGRLASLETLQHAALGQEQGAAQQWLTAQGLDRSQRLGEVLQVEAGWETAVETVLGQLIEAAVVDASAQLLPVVADFSDGHLALIDARQTPFEAPTDSLASKVRGPDAARRWLAPIRVADGMEEAQSVLPTLAAHEAIITRQGEWIGPGWLRLLRSGASGQGALLRERDIHDLRAQIERQAEQEAELGEQITQCRHAVGEAEQQREDAQRALYLAHRSVAELAGQMQSQQGKLESAQARLQRIDAELGQLQQDTLGAQERAREARQALELALARMAELEDQRVTYEQERRELGDKRDLARTGAREARDAAHDLALKLQSARTEGAALEQSLLRMHAQRDALQQRHAEVAAQLAQGDAPIKALEAERQTSLDQRVVAERELAAARSGIDGVMAELRRYEGQRQSSDQHALALREEIGQKRVNEEGFKLRIETLLEAITGAGLELAQVMDELPGDAEIGSWRQAVADLEARIRRLEPVNLAAISEYGQAQQRKEYLDAQNTDLVTALETLEAAIRKIDRETRGRFKDTFDRVNTGIQALYPRLFGGGHAYLELTGEDLLDTGVAIMARPPGKRVSNISLLSGGEKAMTAVALVFSIFQLNPAPFCLLDEVDAPLDEANVGRFSAMVGEMSDKVQFLFVTHNKATMEAARQLAGVTMREPGVSRLVSVDLAEAARLAGAA
ncbi:MAG TPA: chromosome segregation protein SMC [Chiayiivirga sp.]|nr:chromosome segregation protein SMC [Chiayiivirga sp.]